MENKKPNKGNSPKPPKPPIKPKSNFNLYWIYGVIALLLLSVNLFQWGNQPIKITIAEFQEMVEAGHVKKVLIINYETAEVELKNDSILRKEYADKYKSKGSFSTEANGMGPQFQFNTPKDSFQEDLKAWGDEYGLHYEYIKRENWSRDLFYWLLPFFIIIGLWLFVMRRMGGGGGPGGQIFNIGKSRAQLFDKNTSVKVNFNDVAGLEEAKEEIQEIVEFLKNPKRYTQLGAKIPKGALLVGPPGTGKTLIAKAVAGEAQVPFFSLSGSDFVEMFVGVGASRVRDLFKQAKEKSPCIIFIDEIDAIGRARGKSMMQGANDERENTLNQLLTEMDGFGSNSGVIIIAATNRADVLDRALLRPGRFDRQIHVDLPELEERKAIFKVHTKSLKLDEGIDLEFLAHQTPGFSGAEIANLCNEAALIAARKHKKAIERQDFLDAVDRVIAGLEKKSKIIAPSEKKVIAFHEAGHATVSWLLPNANPLVKVTIVPRGRSLGAAWYLPEERQITTPSQMNDEMCATLGGRAAEKIIFGEISTGALSDLEKVTKQAYAMVSIYGLNKKVGNLSYYDSTGQNEYSMSKPYSEDMAQTIDKEVSGLVESNYERTLKILEENKDKLTQLAELLLEKEVIFREDLVRIFGEREAEAVRKAEMEEGRKDMEKRKRKAAEATSENKKEAERVEAEAESAKTQGPAPTSPTATATADAPKPPMNDQDKTESNG